MVCLTIKYVSGASIATSASILANGSIGLKNNVAP
jgi:hypothetical protein